MVAVVGNAERDVSLLPPSTADPIPRVDGMAVPLPLTTLTLSDTDDRVSRETERDEQEYAERQDTPHGNLLQLA